MYKRILFSISLILLFLNPVFSRGKVDFSQTDEILKIGNEFSAEYKNYLNSKERFPTRKIFQQANKISEGIVSYMQTEEFKEISKQSRDFRENVKRIKAASEYLQENFRTISDEEIETFTSDLDHSFKKLNEIKSNIIEENRKILFEKIVKILRITFLSVFVLTLIFIIIIQIMKTKLYAYKVATKKDMDFMNIVFKAQEDERIRISSELHDTVVQEIKKIRIESQNENPNSEKISETATESMNKIRSICNDLVPQEVNMDIKDINLSETISFFCKKFQERTNIECTFVSDKNIPQIKSSEKLLHIIRIVQEALNNIEKHSEATNCSVIIRKSKIRFIESKWKFIVSILKSKRKSGNIDDSKFVIFITDNGKGIPKEVLKSDSDSEGKMHFGLQSMRNRAKLIGGELSIQSEEDDGTVIELRV